MKRRDFIRSAGSALILPSYLARSRAARTMSTLNGGGGYTFDYYIGPNGDDNNNGLTPATAWSITALNSKQATYAGKKIGIIGDVAGTQTRIQYGRIGGVTTSLYSMYQALNGGNSGTILGINGGSSGSPTVLAACNSSGVYVPPSSANGGCWAILDFSSPGSGGATVPTVSGYAIGQNTYNGGGGSGWNIPPNIGYVTVDGIAIFYFTQCALAFSSDTQTFTMPGITVQNCEIAYGANVSTANNPGGLSVAGVSGLTVTNCKFHDMSCTNAAWGMAACMMYGNTSTPTAITFKNNTVYKCGSTWYCKDFTHSFADFSYNYCDHGNFGSAGTSPAGVQYGPINGLVVPSGATSTHHHNIFLGAINCHPTGGGGGTAGTIVAYNNTIYGSSSYGSNFNAIELETAQSGAALQFTYNIVYTDGGTYDSGGGYGGCFIVSTNVSLSNSTFNDNVYGSNSNGVQFGSALFSTQNFASWKSARSVDASSVQVASSPFNSTPTALSPSSFAVGSSVVIGGTTCGALDGSGSIGCNF